MINLAEPYEDLTFMTAMSQQRADALVAFIADDLDGTVVDVGCGWAEFLLQVVATAPTATGIGVDLHQPSIDHGRELALARGVSERVNLICGDAKEQLPERVDAVVCIGASQIWGPPTSECQPLDYPAALAALRAMVPRGARVVYGEGIWSSPPTPEAVAPLAGRLDELVTLAELVELAVAHGFMPYAVQEATTEEWDAFESGYSACYARWLGEHGAQHPDAPEVRARASRQRSAYFGGYRQVMGMAYLALLAV